MLTILAACAQHGALPPPTAALPPAPPPPARTPGAIASAAMLAGLGEDTRARRPGDVLTIALVERTEALKSAAAGATRKSALSLTLPKAKPFSSLPPGLFTGGAETSFAGQGSATQSNRLTGEISVVVTEVTANGLLAVEGRKTVRLNRGDEYIVISGLVRPEDVGPDNRVPSNRVAGARITYAGSGEIAAQSRQGWVQRLLNLLTPF
ncbi:MAG: flagellar basal body L-ring protein FlgH [Sphingomonadaceae bacterium]|nr:flagellar basal body L-ring protein FlgH [Sphingomonadaceae bacterium]